MNLRNCHEGGADARAASRSATAPFQSLRPARAWPRLSRSSGYAGSRVTALSNSTRDCSSSPNCRSALPRFIRSMADEGLSSMARSKHSMAPRSSPRCALARAFSFQEDQLSTTAGDELAFDGMPEACAERNPAAHKAPMRPSQRSRVERHFMGLSNGRRRRGYLTARYQPRSHALRRPQATYAFPVPKQKKTCKHEPLPPRPEGRELIDAADVVAI